MNEIIIGKLTEFSNAMNESLRVIKTNIQFSGDDVKVIVMTSSAPDEGKTTTALNLARSLAMSSENKVLLIDTDIRKTILAARLRVRQANGNELTGLSNYLAGRKKIEDIIYHNSQTNMDIIFAGSKAPNPTELLEKEYFAKLIEYARANYDYVIIDCAPIGAAIDAAVVSTLCDGAVLVIAQGQESVNTIQGVIKQLKASGVKILGAVLTKVKSKKNGYGYGYGYGYGNYYGNES